MKTIRLTPSDGISMAGGIDFAPVLPSLIETLSEGDALVFAPGEYHFWPDRAATRELYISNTDSREYPVKPIGILAVGKKNLTITGEKATLVFHGSIMALCLVDCENVTVSGLTIAHGCPTVIDATVASLWQQNGATEIFATFPPVYEATIDGATVHWKSECSPYTGEPYWGGSGDLALTQHLRKDGHVRRVKEGLFHQAVKVRKDGVNGLFITYQGLRDIAQGDVFQFRLTQRDVCGMHLDGCRNIALHDLWIQYTCGMGLIAQRCHDLQLHKIRYEAAGLGMHSASAADMFHLSGCYGKIRISQCTFVNPHDDPINVHGTFLQAEKADGNRLQLRFMHSQTLGFTPFAPGDKAQFYDSATLLPLGEPIPVVSVEGPRREDLTTCTITLAAEPSLPRGVSVIVDNASAQPQVTIVDCVFHSIPTRGILLSTAGDSLIMGNRFTQVHMACVYIACDGEHWYESGPVRRVEIRENTFSHCHSRGIFIDPTNTTDCDEKVHGQITIAENEFVDMPAPHIKGKSVERITAINNRCYAEEAPAKLSVQVESCGLELHNPPAVEKP